MKKLGLSICLCAALVLAGYSYQAYSLNASLMPMPKAQFVDANGKPYAGGKLVTCQPGATCTLAVNTPKATYTDALGAGTNTNPVILDSAGRANIWLNGLYKVALYDMNNVLVWTEDNVSSGSGLSTPYWSDIANYTSLNALVAAAGSAPTIVVIYAANTVSASLVIPSTMILWFVPGGSLALSGGVTLTLPDPDHINAPKGQRIFTGAGSAVYNNQLGTQAMAWDGTGVSQVGINKKPSAYFDFSTGSIEADGGFTGVSTWMAGVSNVVLPDWMMMGGLLKAPVGGVSVQMGAVTPYQTGYLVVSGRNGVTLWGEGASGVSVSVANGMKFHSGYGSGTTGVWCPPGYYTAKLILKWMSDGVSGTSIYAEVWSKIGPWYSATGSPL